MANCNECVKINPIPECLTGVGTFEIINITFPDNPGATIVGVLKDTANDHVEYINFTEGDPIDLTDVFPLMQHIYELKFYVDGVPVNFTITNPDATTVDACCIEFQPLLQLGWSGSDYEVSTTNCTTT